jgi:hypothetical protein
MGWRGRRELIGVQLACRLAACSVDLKSRASRTCSAVYICLLDSRKVCLCLCLHEPARCCLGLDASVSWMTFTPVVGRAADRLQGSAASQSSHRFATSACMSGSANKLGELMMPKSPLGYSHGIVFMALGHRSLSSSFPPSQHQGCHARLSKPAILSLA